MRLRLKRFSFVFALLFIIIGLKASAQSDYPRSLRLGLAFVNAPNVPNPDARYRNALIVGAGWNRIPLYWNDVERQPGFYDWSAYDRIVHADALYGLRTTLILLGIPSFRRDGAIPAGLYAPTFNDNSDLLGGSKLPHPNNAWANFVYAAVLRYKPAGIGTGGVGGVRVWEIWNEPDLAMFWNGTVQDYVRMLKVAYLIIKHVDPDAKVMFGGLAEGDPQIASRDFLNLALLYIGQDSMRVTYNWYMDIVALHTYTNPMRSRVAVQRARATMARFGIDRPIWLTETGLSVWDEYPGPTQARDAPAERSLRGTQRQQAAYVIQSTVLAWAAGAEVVFWHQLYDDCGNQSTGAQVGDAHGLFRNEQGAACFNAHPQPGSPRLAAGAFLSLAQALGRETIFASAITEVGGEAISVTFDTGVGYPTSRITVIWSRRGRPRVEVPASGNAAIITSPNEGVFSMLPTDGWYTLDLPDAGAVDSPYGSTGEVTYVGGMPYIMVEMLLPGTTGVDLRARLPGTEARPLYSNESGIEGTPTLAPTATIAPSATPDPNATPRPIPTFDGSLTLAPPIPFVSALPEVSPSSFLLQWGSYDPISVAAYLIWVRVDGGEWSPWQTTTATSGIYTGESGRLYEFAVWAVNRAGGWSANVELIPMAWTRIG